MSVFYVAQWSVRPADVSACEAALAVIAQHIREAHPGIKSIQTFRQAWGPQPRRAYIWYEEYDSLTAMENEKETPECALVWKPVEEMSMEGTFFGSVWSDPNRSLWFIRK